MINEIQALQNFADTLNLKVNIKHSNDKRKTVNKYFATLDGTSVSPVLDYGQLNHFFLGWSKCLDRNK